MMKHVGSCCSRLRKPFNPLKKQDMLKLLYLLVSGHIKQEKQIVVYVSTTLE